MTRASLRSSYRPVAARVAAGVAAACAILPAGCEQRPGSSGSLAANAGTRQDGRPGMVEAELAVTPGSITTADRCELRLTVAAPPEFRVPWPSAAGADSLGGFAVVARAEPPPTLDGLGRVVRTLVLTLEPDLPGDYVIDGLRVVTGEAATAGGTAGDDAGIELDAVTIRVASVLGPDPSQEAFAPAKGPLDPAPGGTSGSRIAVAIGAGATALVGVSAWLWIRRRRGRAHGSGAEAAARAFRELESILVAGLDGPARGDAVARAAGLVLDALAERVSPAVRCQPAGEVPARADVRAALADPADLPVLFDPADAWKFGGVTPDPRAAQDAISAGLRAAGRLAASDRPDGAAAP